VVAALGAGAVFGLVGNAGAASGQSTAVSHVTGAPTASFTFSVSVSGLTPSAVTITGSGQADAATDAASLTVQLPAAVAKLLPGGKAAPEVVKAELVRHTVYQNVLGLSTLVGKPWIAVSIPAADTSQVSGIFSKVASALGDVNSIVALAHSHHATVTSLGSSTVDGVAATGHKIVTTLAHGKAAVTADLWADSSDRLVQADAKVAVTTKKHHADISASLDLSKYGAPVTIAAPPSSQVKVIPLSTVESFLGQDLHLGQGAGGQHTWPGKSAGAADKAGHWAAGVAAGSAAGHWAAGVAHRAGHAFGGEGHKGHGVFGGLFRLALRF
jgi:hypothetical protein